MDELSVFHYRKELNEGTGETSFKLVLLNFLELPGDFRYHIKLSFIE